MQTYRDLDRLGQLSDSLHVVLEEALVVHSALGVDSQGALPLDGRFAYEAVAVLDKDMVDGFGFQTEAAVGGARALEDGSQAREVGSCAVVRKLLFRGVGRMNLLYRMARSGGTPWCVEGVGCRRAEMWLWMRVGCVLIGRILAYAGKQ